ncbi:MAG: hypothetical protein K6U11_13420 [bacterium]|nr:hypothetical protein [bacterium]
MRGDDCFWPISSLAYRIALVCSILSSPFQNPATSPGWLVAQAARLGSP